MKSIIHEIVEKISNSYEKELRNLICERRDISKFILATKKKLDEIGIKLVAGALEIVDEVYKNTVKSKVYLLI